MKRLLAALLALSMLFCAAPLNALAASDDNFSQTITVHSQPDADLVQAIASDPFLTQTNSAQEQKQTATVDTSDVSMEATNSFGKLLLAGMEEENNSNFSSNNRVTDIKLNGKTATVKYLVEEDADLVVGIYADDAEEQMVASGTVAVTATNDGTATVAITGDIPEYYVIKGYLFDKTEHAPLCDPFTDTFQTKEMTDLANATVRNFPENRVINLDEDEMTNFAVVRQNVTLLTPEDAAGKNTIVQQDNENLNYKIDNASDEIKNLQPGDILTYAYTPGEMLIVKVDTIEISGDSVSIHGDDTLEITDVFDVLKIEQSAGSGELEHRDEGMSPAVTYLGTREDTGLEQSNQFSITEGGISNQVSVADITNHEFRMEGSIKDEEDGSLSVEIRGLLSLNLNIDFAYYLAWSRQYVAVSSDLKMAGELSAEGKLKGKIPLGVLHTSGKLEKIGVKAEAAPNLVVELSGKIGFRYSYSQFSMIAFMSESGLQNRSTPGSVTMTPFRDADGKPEMEIRGFIGVEVGPEIRLWDTVLDVELKVKGGGQVVMKPSEAEKDAKHVCGQCMDLTVSVVGKLTDKLIVFKNDLGKVGIGGLSPIPSEIKFLDLEMGSFYWSVDFEEFGAGSCPHQAWKAKISLKGSSEADIPVFEGEQEIGRTNSNGTLAAYLEPGVHTLTAIAQGTTYRKTFTMRREAAEVVLEPEKSSPTEPSQPTTPEPDKPEPDQPQPDTPEPEEPTDPNTGTCGDHLRWTLAEDGTLTISGTGKMENFAGFNTPWKGRLIRAVVIEEGVTSIGNSAFYECSDLTKIVIPESVNSIGDSVFYGCKALSEIELPESIERIGAGAFYGCSRLKKIVLPKKLETIEDYLFYGCVQLTKVELPDSATEIGLCVFNGCSRLISIVIPETVTVIRDAAFENCSGLTNIALPESGEIIGAGTFRGCSSLTSIELPQEITSIENQTFSGCTQLETIVLGEKIQSIDYSAFYQCDSLKNIVFAGTKAQWRKVAVNKDYDGNHCLLNATIYCMNGDILPISSENSITTGKTSESNSRMHAVFNGVTAGKTYAVIISRSADDPLDAGNLLYLNQKTAGADGILDVPFVLDDLSASYVVACIKGGSAGTAETPETPGKKDEPAEPVKPADPGSSGETTKPDQPGEKPSTDKPGGTVTPKPEQSKSDDGGGAVMAVVLLGGAAAAVTAGVILMMPVEVSGIVRLSDGTVLKNAIVQLMQEDQLAAQSMTDESGHFALEVRRGDYKLNVITIDPETGEQILRTTSIKAPVKDAEITF